MSASSCPCTIICRDTRKSATHVPRAVCVCAAPKRRANIALTITHAGRASSGAAYFDVGASVPPSNYFVVGRPDPWSRRKNFRTNLSPADCRIILSRAGAVRRRYRLKHQTSNNVTVDACEVLGRQLLHMFYISWWCYIICRATWHYFALHGDKSCCMVLQGAIWWYMVQYGAMMLHIDLTLYLKHACKICTTCILR